MSTPNQPVNGRKACFKIVRERVADSAKTAFKENSVTALLPNPQRHQYCWISLTGVDRSNDGYIRLKIDRKIRAFGSNSTSTSTSNSSSTSTGRHSTTLHVIAFAAVHGTIPSGVGSHLCGTPACFNPLHILDETQKVNYSRGRCPGVIVCAKHRHTILDLCQHTPKCIKELYPVDCCLKGAPEFQTNRTPGIQTSIDPYDLLVNLGSDTALIERRRDVILKIVSQVQMVGSKTGQIKRKFDEPPPSSGPFEVDEVAEDFEVSVPDVPEKKQKK